MLSLLKTVIKLSYCLDSSGMLEIRQVYRLFLLKFKEKPLIVKINPALRYHKGSFVSLLFVTRLCLFVSNYFKPNNSHKFPLAKHYRMG